MTVTTIAYKHEKPLRLADLRGSFGASIYRNSYTIILYYSKLFFKL